MLKEYTIKSSKKEKEHSVILCFNDAIMLIPEKCSCDCKYGSFYRFTQKNLIAGRWKCIHINEAIKKFENGEPDNIQIAREVENEKRKPIYPVIQQRRDC
jgi:hypothetical protein